MITTKKYNELIALEGAHLKSKDPAIHLKNSSIIIGCILDLMGKWNARTAEITEKEWVYLGELSALRLAWLSSSLENLAEGTFVGKYSDKRVHITDLSGIHALSRTQLEAYLTFFYLFIQPTSEDERDVRIGIYMLQSLTVRTSHSFPEYPIFEQQVEENRKVLLRVKENLRNNPVFKAYQKQQRDSILEGRYAKRASWTKLIDDCKLESRTTKMAYDLYANHAHSEYISMIQFRDGVIYPDQANSLVLGVLKSSVFRLSLFLRELAVLYNATDLYNQIDEELRVKISMWAGLATKWHESTFAVDL